MILKYYFMASGQDWKQILQKHEDNCNGDHELESVDDYEQCFHFNSDDGFTVLNSNYSNHLNNKCINIFVFNRKTDNFSNKYPNVKTEALISRIQIDIETNTYKIDYLPNINSPAIKRGFNRH